MVYVFAAFFCVFGSVVSSQFVNFNKLVLPPTATGPESVSFRQSTVDPGAEADGPYTTVRDGRILRWQDSNVGFVDFAKTAFTRTKGCDGSTNPDSDPICGRPVALSFDPLNFFLYAVDAGIGLFLIGPTGGGARISGDFNFATGLDVDLLTGNIYVSDASLTYRIRDITKPGFTPDSTGRLLRFNQLTRQVSVLLSGLFGGGGPAVSSDGTFVLVPEFYGKRILKYWLVGPKANTAEVLIKTTGNPNKITRAGRIGEFWVAVSVSSQLPTPSVTPQGVRFNSNGVVLQTVSFATELSNKTVSVVREEDRKLYVGSSDTNFIGVYSN